MKTAPLSLSAALSVIASVSADHMDAILPELNGLQAPCLAVLQEALCLLQFPKCNEQTQQVLPVCQSVRAHVEEVCLESLLNQQAEGFNDEDKANKLAMIRDQLVLPGLDAKRWAATDAIQKPDCVSFASIDNTRVINILDGDQEQTKLASEPLEAQSVVEDKNDIAEADDEQTAAIRNELVKVTLETRHMSRRERGSKKHHHHHHHHKAQKRDEISVSASNKDKAEEEEAHVAPLVAIRADTPSAQGTYAISKDEPKVCIPKSATSNDKAKKVEEPGVLVHEKVGHSETKSGPPAVAPDGQGQRVLIQGGSGTDSTDPATSVESLGKASEGHTVDKDATEGSEGSSNEEAYPQKGTVLMAAVPILFVMGAIAGFTIYRRYYENSFNQGGRNDSRDDYPGDGYHQRAPVVTTTINIPPPPSQQATVSSDRPPSAGSVGKNRFQELSRSYDFGAGLRSIKNALTRSNNSSRDSALNQANAAGGLSTGSLSGRNSGQYAPAFGAGGHSIAKIGSHPGLNALERQQLQAQFGSGVGVGSSSSSSAAGGASSALASNLGAARKFGSINSLSMLNSSGKYSHHHRQRSSDHQHHQHNPAGSPRDSIGEYLSPESPSMLTREELMRRRELYSEGYTFGSEKGSLGDDAHSETDLLFDARDHFFDLAGSEKAAAQLRDEEMDMYLEMEKEESPFVVDDYNSMNPSPYEPKVLTRQMLERKQSIQKTAALKEKGISEEAKAQVATGTGAGATGVQRSQSKKGRRKLAKQAKKLQQKQESAKVQETTTTVFDEKKALEAEDSVAVAAVGGGTVTDTDEAEQQTHVLGCDSPDWKE
ncbi:hypothetical protein BGX29_003077 [Mortierella sp. GBA35]|nr:hypothetical protein BGX29_003077 [Mortierella sp. GBA35]